ncbi:MAG: response regulator transcription factor [Oscillospiraceae bacterium]|nr:response regulator transcription factor [Oscillospiraceae bacterium]
MNKTILLISGDPSCAESFPTEDGSFVRSFSDAERAISFAEREQIDLAVLDSELPGGGLSVLQRLRVKFAFPIIMLSSADSEAERIAPLMLGADDIVTKPFSPLELSAHIQVQLRRGMRYDSVRSVNSEVSPDAELSEIVIDGLCINNLTHKCCLDGEEIKLTPLEFSILWYLCARRGRVVPGEELFEAVWGEKYLDSAGTVMPHIARLRGKLHEPPRRPKYVKTVWGVGYTVDI